LQVEELFRFAGTAAGFSYFGALLTLGVLIDTGEVARGSIWFLWATAVTMFRFATLVAYHRRDPKSDPTPWQTCWPASSGGSSAHSCTPPAPATRRSSS